MSFWMLTLFGSCNGVAHESGGAVFVFIVAAVGEVFHAGQGKLECGAHGVP